MTAPQSETPRTLIFMRADRRAPLYCAVLPHTRRVCPRGPLFSWTTGASGAERGCRWGRLRWQCTRRRTRARTRRFLTPLAAVPSILHHTRCTRPSSYRVPAALVGALAPRAASRRRVVCAARWCRRAGVLACSPNAGRRELLPRRGWRPPSRRPGSASGRDGPLKERRGLGVCTRLRGQDCGLLQYPRVARRAFTLSPSQPVLPPATTHHWQQSRTSAPSSLLAARGQASSTRRCVPACTRPPPPAPDERELRDARQNRCSPLGAEAQSARLLSACAQRTAASQC